MKVELTAEGAEPIGADGAVSEHWISCPGRATIKARVTCSPPTSPDEGTAGSAAPRLRVTYFSVFGVPPETRATMRPAVGAGSWVGEWVFAAPLFVPMRVRIEVQPAYGRPLAHIFHVVPRASARLATAVTAAALVAAALLLMRTLMTLRLALVQYVSGASGAALLAATGYVLRAGMRPPSGYLPLLGVAHLVHRSLAAVLLGFLALSALLRGCVVTIHNDTAASIRMNLPWRPEPEVIAARSEISVIPPDVRSFRAALFGQLEDRERRALCIHDPEGPRHPEDGCREGPGDDPFRRRRSAPLRWFTPPTVALRCGPRWPGLDARRVVEHRDGLELEGDVVWITPPDGCVGEVAASLWYREAEGDLAVHLVRYPWRPERIEELGRLWIDAVEDEAADRLGVTLVSQAPQQELVGETRIKVRDDATGRDRGWPVAGLPKAEEPRLDLTIGEHTSHLRDMVASAATLACQRAQGSGSVFRATRLALRGEHVGWLKELTLSGAGGLTSSSTWKLTGDASAPVAVPWVCDAQPGEDPRRPREKRMIRALNLVVDTQVDPGLGTLAVVLPALFVPEQIIVSDKDGKLGTLKCSTTAGEGDLMAIGRVIVETHRPAAASLAVSSETDRWIDNATWTAAAGDTRAAWLCWRLAGDPVTVTVKPDAGAAIRAAWDHGAATLKLDRPGRVLCYQIAETGAITRKPPRTSGYKRQPEETLRRLKRVSPEARGCEVLYTK